MYLYGIEMQLSDKSAYLNTVLIVPLWNWNQHKFEYASGGISFNCTFMELKFGKTFFAQELWEF